MTKGLFDDLPKGSISEILIERITNALINGDIKPGDKIPTEIEFSENLGVSRNAVREAIKVLVAFGVLEIRRSEGTFVVEDYNPKLMDPMLYGLILSQHSMEELLETKLALANSIMYLAILNASDAQIAVLREKGEHFRKVMNDKDSTPKERYDASKDFNIYLGEIANNKMVLQMDSVIHKIAKFTRTKALEESIQRGTPDILPANYLKEVDLIQARDKKGIAEFMDERLAIWKDLLL